jgi:uncharacterized membrane protein
MKRFLGTLRAKALAGLVVVVPVVVTILALRFVFRTVDGLLGPWIAHLLGRSIPGLGIIATVILVLGAGTVATNLLGRRAISLAERLFTQIPLVRRIYRASKDIVENATLSKMDSVRDVVMIEHPRRGVYAYGFVTSYTERMLPTGPQRLANVFIPGPPVPTSGVLIAVPVEDLYFPDLPVEDALKLILSAGMAAPKTLRARGLPESATGETGGPV